MAGPSDKLSQIIAASQAPAAPARPLSPMEKLSEIITLQPPTEVDVEDINQTILRLSALERDVAEGFRSEEELVPLKKKLAGRKNLISTEKTGVTPPIRDGAAALALARGTGASFLKGVLTPVSGFMPSITSALERQIAGDRETVRKHLQQPTWGVKFDATSADLLASAPGVAAEFAAYAIPGAAAVKGANALWGVGKGLSLARNTAAGMTAGASFSLFAKHDSGEDRAYYTMLDALTGGMLEPVVFPILHSVTRAELGKRTRDVVAQVSKDLNITVDAAESHVAGMRGGINAQDVETARAVVKATQDTEKATSPVAAQAKKVIEATEKRLPKKWTFDATLPSDYGIRLDLVIDGQPTPIRLKRDPKIPNSWEQQMVALAQAIDAARQQGKKVSIENAITPHKGTASRLINFLQGKTRKRGPVPDAPPPATRSHTGDIPAVGEKVQVRSGDGRIEMEVVETAASPVPVTVTRASTPGVASSATQGGASEISVNARRQLYDLGFSKLEVDNMTPVHAQGVLRIRTGEKPVPPKVEPKVESGAEAITPTTGPTPPSPSGSRLQPGFVRLKNLSNGKEEVRSLKDIFAQVPAKGARVQFKPHSDGKDRRFVVDLASGDFLPEPMDQPGGWWRTSLFTTEDPTAEFNHQLVKGFIHNDGSITLSANPVTLFETEAAFSPTASFGPQDRVMGSRALDTRRTESTSYLGRGIHKETTQVDRSATAGRALPFSEESPGGKSAVGDPFVSEPQEGLTTFSAGFEPRRQRSHRRVDQGFQVAVEPGTTSRALVREDIAEPVGAFGRPLPQPTVRPKQKPLNPLELDGRVFKVAKKGKNKLQPYELTREMGEAAEAVTLRNAARRLIKQGASESTPVRARIAHDLHKQSASSPAMTLGELANMDLKSVPYDSLREEAAFKGYRVLESAEGVKLTSLATGEHRTFEHRLEAMEALGRIPVSREGEKIEGVLEAAWNMGRERGWDADVDLKMYQPKEVADVAVEELAQAKRPGISIWVQDAAPTPGGAKVFGTTTEGEVMGSVANMESLLAQLGRGNPALRDIKVFDVGPVNGRRELFLYNEKLVPVMFAKYSKALRILGVEVTQGGGLRNTEHILRDLAVKVPDGLDILKGRDPSDALMYSWLKKNGMKEEFLKGELATDAQGPYRKFPTEVKRGFGTVCP